MALLLALLGTILILTFTNAEVIRCSGGDCQCDQSISGEACVLEYVCYTATHQSYKHIHKKHHTFSCSVDDICKGHSLICRASDICYVQCSAKSSCSAGTTIYANGATDVKVACLAQDACIDSGHIYCGSGDCFLSCADSTSCINLGIVHTTNTISKVTTTARSFGCKGFCPFHLPKSYSLSPTPAPTYMPTKSPSKNPTKYPTYSPTNPPTSNTFSPTTSPSENPSLSPTKTPTNLTKPPLTSISPTSFPTYFPSPNPTPKPVQPAPNGFEYGAYNQLCKESVISTAKACDLPTQNIGDYRGDLTCLHPYDCCMCKSVQCGYQATMPCDTLRIGEFGVYGVEKVLVTGSKAMRASGATIECFGGSACKQSHIYGKYVESIHCDAASSCKNAKIVIDYPKTGFSLDCLGSESCADLQIEINLEGPPPGFKCNPNYTPQLVEFGIIACDQNGCDGLDLTINNQGCDRVLIEEIQCLQPNSCDFAQFNLIGNVDIASCHNLNMKQCFDALTVYKCHNSMFCSDKAMVFTNPLNGFLFECSTLDSCMNSKFTFVVEENSVEAVTFFDSFVMRQINAGQNSTFVIDNRQSAALKVNRLDCVAKGACNYMTLVIGSNVLVEKINCVKGACIGCVIKQRINELRGTPCNPQIAAAVYSSPI